MDVLRWFNGQQRGGTAAEYALMISLIAIAIFVAVQALGLNLIELFEDDQLTGAFDS